MRNKATSFIFLFLFFACSLNFQAKIKEKDLPQKYRDWLKLVSYIILPQERDVFMELTTNRDRDLFIQTFWKQRDPTPGTPQNEFKDEHIKRFLYANNYFRRGTPREGWMTDMGRIYIILGPPVSIERFEGVAGIYPAQVWYYYGDRKKGLPTHFGLVFYQREGSGEFKLYNPTSDGPESLIIDKRGLDTTNYPQMYEKLKELAPTLANMAVSLIPGQVPYNYQPSPQANVILAKILESPKKDINPSYATHFLKYKGIVTTEYLTNYVQSEAKIAWSYDPVQQMHFLHFSIVPKKISVDYFEPKDQYFCNFKLNVSLRKGKDIIFQYGKDFPFYFSPDNLDNIRANGIAIQDSFPIIEGEYELNILAQNSVGKEFTVFEKTVSIPEQSSLPKLVNPILGYDLQEYKSPMQMPFKFMDKKLVVDPKNTFSASDKIACFFTIVNLNEDLWKKGKVKITIIGLKKNNPSHQTYVLELKNYPFSPIFSINSSFLAKDLNPDYYDMKIALIDESGRVLDEKVTNFIVSPQVQISHPVILAKAFPLSNNFLYYYALAYQYDKVKKYSEAEQNYGKAYVLNPNHHPGLVEYANFLLKVNKFDQALSLVESIKNNEKMMFDYYLVKGIALMKKGEFAVAIENLQEGNKIYNSDTRLLNSLGICYFEIGQTNKALEVLKASLRLDPEQDRVKEMIKKIEEDSKLH